MIAQYMHIQNKSLDFSRIELAHEPSSLRNWLSGRFYGPQKIKSRSQTCMRSIPASTILEIVIIIIEIIDVSLILR